MTGSVYPADDAVRKLLQLLQEAVLRLRSVAVFANPSNEAAASMVKLLRADALTMGLDLQVVEGVDKGDFEAAFTAIDSVAPTAANLMRT